MGNWVRSGSYKTSNCILYKRNPEHLKIISALEEYGNDSEFIRRALEHFVKSGAYSNGTSPSTPPPDLRNETQKTVSETEEPGNSGSLDEMRNAMDGL